LKKTFATIFKEMRQVARRLKKIRMLICDVDGVLTDGRLWISDDGKWRRFFHVKDGVGLKLLMEAGYEVGVISGGKSDDVVQRMGFLSIKHFYLEAADKLPPFNEILVNTKFKPEEIAFIGDEVFDIPVLKRVGFAATVPNAVADVKKCAHYVTKTPGGMGAVREISDLILKGGALSLSLKKGGRRS
jgi:3-deoxy-D-manno-octulosonate 8-phosphate phosphatase (KDO 8-P phosphatase)